MADKTKGPAMLLFVLLFAAVAAATLGFIGLQKEKQKNAVLTQEKEELEIKKKAAEKEVFSLKQQVGDLRQEIAQAQAKIQEFDSRINLLNGELSAEKKAKEDALLEAEKRRDEITALENTKSGLEVDLRASNETIASLRDKLAALEASVQKMEEEQKIQAATQDVQLEKIVIPSQSEPAQAEPAQALSPQTSQISAPQTPPEGKVLVVNKEYDFVVVNIGQKDNLVVGDTLVVFRKEKKIAEIKVEEVRDTMSVAVAVTSKLLKQIKEDDRVVRK